MRFRYLYFSAFNARKKWVGGRYLVVVYANAIHIFLSWNFPNELRGM